MPSAFEADEAARFVRSFLTPFGQTVIRRIGGQPDRAEPVEAVVHLKVEGGGLVNNADGQVVDFGGVIEILADQENGGHDTWVIDGEVFHQIGEATSKDAGSQSINLTRRKGRIAKEPRTRGR